MLSPQYLMMMSWKSLLFLWEGWLIPLWRILTSPATDAYLSFLCNETVLISTKLAQVFVYSKKNFDVNNSSSLAWHHKFSDWATDQELEQCKIFIFIFFRLSDNNALGSFFSLMEQFSRWNIYRQETFHHFTEKYPDIVSTDSDEETVLLLQNPQISER